MISHHILLTSFNLCIYACAAVDAGLGVLQWWLSFFIFIFFDLMIYDGPARCIKTEASDAVFVRNKYYLTVQLYVNMLNINNIFCVCIFVPCMCLHNCFSGCPMQYHIVVIVRLWEEKKQDYPRLLFFLRINGLSPLSCIMFNLKCCVLIC